MAESRLQTGFWSPHRREVLSRTIAAIFGGYLFATVAATFLARLLRLTPAESVMTALLGSFVLYAAAIMWVFAVRTAARAWLSLVASSVLLGAVAFLMGGGPTS